MVRVAVQVTTCWGSGYGGLRKYLKVVDQIFVLVVDALSIVLFNISAIINSEPLAKICDVPTD